jgi:hypothetical protein
VDVPPNGRYVTLVGGESGVRISKQPGNSHEFTLAQLLSCMGRVRENAVINWDGVVQPDRVAGKIRENRKAHRRSLHSAPAELRSG